MGSAPCTFPGRLSNEVSLMGVTAACRAERCLAVCHFTLETKAIFCVCSEGITGLVLVRFVSVRFAGLLENQMKDSWGDEFLPS